MCYDLMSLVGAELTLEMLLDQVACFDYKVRMAVAKYPETPEDVLKILAKDRSSYQVRMEVATNPNATVEILTLLAEDKRREVRSAVARNDKATLEILKRLMELGAEALDIARNPNASSDILKQLYDENYAPSKRERLRAMERDYRKKVRQAAVFNRNADHDFLKKVAIEEPCDDVRSYIAMRESVSPEILHILANDRDSLVRRMVVFREDVPTDILVSVAENADECEFVLRIVANHKKTPEDIKKKLLEDEEIRRERKSTAGSRVFFDASDEGYSRLDDEQWLDDPFLDDNF